jgi:hypothetical protein
MPAPPCDSRSDERLPQLSPQVPSLNMSLANKSPSSHVRLNRPRPPTSSHLPDYRYHPYDFRPNSLLPRIHHLYGDHPRSNLHASSSSYPYRRSPTYDDTRSSFNSSHEYHDRDNLDANGYRTLLRFSSPIPRTEDGT